MQDNVDTGECCYMLMLTQVDIVDTVHVDTAHKDNKQRDKYNGSVVVAVNVLEKIF